jgi:transcriptional regulator with XRE-family HTH domain
MAKQQGSDSMRMWGALHKAYRMAANLTHEEVATFVGYSPSLVISIERGVRMPSETFVERADEITRAGGMLIKAAEHLSRQRYPVWFEDYVIEEQRARTIWSYDMHVIKGLLQTEEYARAVLSALHPPLEEEEIEARLKARLERQKLLTRKPTCVFSYVVEEWVLRRPIGGRAVMKRQLEHLIEVSEMRNVSIQVMPMSYESHAGLDGPMTLLETPEHKWLAYFEVQEHSQLLDDANRVSLLQERYAMIRSQALTPRESVKLIEQLAGEL